MIMEKLKKQENIKMTNLLVMYQQYLKVKKRLQIYIIHKMGRKQEGGYIYIQMEKYNKNLPTKMISPQELIRSTMKMV